MYMNLVANCDNILTSIRTFRLASWLSSLCYGVSEGAFCVMPFSALLAEVSLSRGDVVGLSGVKGSMDWGLVVVVGFVLQRLSCSVAIEARDSEELVAVGQKH